MKKPMSSKKLSRIALLFLLVLLVLVASVFTGSSRSAAQTGGLADSSGVWRAVDATGLPPAPAGTRTIIPARFRTAALNTAQLRTILARAPLEFTLAAKTSRVEISLPTPDGKFARFRAEESPVMEAGLAAKHPEIKTYRAQGLDDPAATARFGLTPYGFHAIVLSPKGNYYIDPYRRGDTVNHISYFKRDLPRTEAQAFECHVHLPGSRNSRALTAETAAAAAATRPNGGTLRTYRLALAADYEYSQYHSPGTISDKAEVLARGIVPAVNRVVGIYEREVAVHMNLVTNEDLIIFNTPADPYVNEDGTSMLATNQATVDSIIGPLNYDIGHVASTGGGGVAFLGVVCSAQKAGGVTGLPAPTGDGYYVDYVAHEMGHQFGGNHTFNSEAGSCGGGNRNAGTAYEVGSGSSIMAYAGICSPDNLQPHSDDNFHTASYDEILTYITTSGDPVNGGGDTCAVKTQTGNNAPTVDAGPDFNIPARTPFTLTATGSDADGDTLTYNWEEFDLGAANDGRTDNGASPIFRPFASSSNPSRTFPKQSDLLNNISTYGEILPTTTRTMTFRVTARDNHAAGGGVDYDSMKVNVKATAGPFLVTSPNGGEVWNTGETRIVTWNVANTNAAPINTASVDISLSTDGGKTFPVVLAAGVPNDGSQDVSVPSVSTATARVRVSPTANIFFDISNADFSVNSPLPPLAHDDAATTDFQTPVSIPVLANDNDPGSFTLSIASVQSPTAAGGTASLSDNGTPSNTADDQVLYTPPPQYHGPDSFTYTASNGTLTASAVVGVTVNPFCAPLNGGSFLANFEADANGFTVSTPTNAPASPAWSRVADPAAHSPTMSFFTDGAATQGAVKDDRLISPPQFISPTTHLVFFQRFDLENDFDAGVLEVSTNGGASFTDITNAGATFISGAYNHVMGNGGLAGRNAWSGRSTGFAATPPSMTRVEVNLGALAGKTAVFRWRLRTDDLTLDEAVGWFVDDVQFTNLLVAPPCNEPPFAVSQALTTNEDTPHGVALNALQGDDNDALTFNVESAPAHGALSGAAPNLTYTPEANYNGADSFTFRASDGTNDSNLATVTINVLSVNDPPLAGDDAATVVKNSAANAFDVLRNDMSAPDGGEALSIQSVTQGASGAVAIIDGGARLTYTPSANFTGSDSFTYTLSDGNGGLAVASVGVNVKPAPNSVNYALNALGSLASASSVYANRSYPASGAFDGNVAGAFWEQGGGWNDDTRDLWPDWLQVDFAGSRTINEVRVYTLQNDFNSPVPPNAATDASAYGLIDYDVQFWDGSEWQTVPGGQVRGNTRAMKVVSGLNITTTKMRVFVTGARAHYSRVVEFEAYGPSGQ
jgi:hypothetical protein